MTRFFVAPEQIKNGQVVLTGDDVKHITKVLRLEVGSEIVVLDGEGREYHAQLTELLKGKIVGKIIKETSSKVEPPILVNLIQGLPKGEKIDFIIQKCTEIGINSIKPVNTERSVVKLDTKKALQRVERWQKIAREAAEQSHRTIIPQILGLEDLQTVLEDIETKGLILIPWEAEKSLGLKEVLQKQKELMLQGTGEEIYLIIGPEGGFSEKEIKSAVTKGAIPVSLGPRILRTETAGLAALTMILYELGDLGCR